MRSLDCPRFSAVEPVSAAEGPGFVGLRQSRDGSPAFGAQPGRRLRIVPERQEQRAARLARKRFEQPVGIEREAGRRLLGAASGGEDRVSAPAPEQPAHAFGIKGEAEPALVFETMALRRIERDPRLREIRSRYPKCRRLCLPACMYSAPMDPQYVSRSACTIWRSVICSAVVK